MIDSERRRGDPRDTCRIPASIVLSSDRSAIPCIVTEISAGGARLEVDSAAPLLPTFMVSLPLIPERSEDRQVELRWRDGDHAGVKFVPD